MNVRVGANSPSRCPTMFSVMKIGTCCLPLWMANAKNNHGLDASALTVKLCVFDESVRIRRFWPTARGSAHPIAHRLCHCKVVLTDGKESK